MSPLERFWNKVLLNIGFGYTLSMLIPIVVGVFYLRKDINKPIKIFFFYCILTLFLNTLEQVVIWAFTKYYDFFQPFLVFFELENTFFLQIFFYLKNFILLSIFYNYLFPIKQYKKVILKIGQILSLIALINYFFIVGHKELGIFNPSANVIFLVLLPLIYLWQSQEYSLRIPLSKNPYFWMSIGLIIPNLIGAFILFAGDYMHTDNFILYCQIYSLKNLFEILGQILIAIGFYNSYYARFIKIT